MDNNIVPQNILYIGPYNEQSHRGRYSLSNIEALIAIGHKLKIVPILNVGETSQPTPENLQPFEVNSLENYDVCIQHCDPLQYSFHSGFKKNIAIYTPVGLPEDPILNSRLQIPDNIVVNSRMIKDALKNILSNDIMDNVRYCPMYVDLEKLKNTNTEKLDWTDESRYYFYTELNFNEEYDGEKLVYVYVTTFMNKHCGLIIKTYGLDDKHKIEQVKNTIDNIAFNANVPPKPENMPRVLTGQYSYEDTIKVYRSIDCFVDCSRTYEYNNNMFIAASLNKGLLCNINLPSFDFFEKTYGVKSNKCNINISSHNDILSCSMYADYYSMDCKDLREKMMAAYLNRHSSFKSDESELQQYDISNINNILC